MHQFITNDYRFQLIFPTKSSTEDGHEITQKNFTPQSCRYFVVAFPADPVAPGFVPEEPSSVPHRRFMGAI